MNKKTKILQIGTENLETRVDQLQIEDVEWNFLDLREYSTLNLIDVIELQRGQTYDAVLCTDHYHQEVLDKIHLFVEAYTLIIDKKFKNEVSEEIKEMKLPIWISMQDKDAVISEICTNFFSGQMGSKFHVNTVQVLPSYTGRKVMFGEDRLRLIGEFSNQDRTPIITWQYNIGMYRKSKKIWLEFEHDENIKLELIVSTILEGSSEVFARKTYSEEEITKGIEVDYFNNLGYISISLKVQGKGILDIGPLHYRDTRHGYGEYIAGGKKITDSRNQEIAYYFHPGDLQPPLNVYFSGYRSAEGFEGFFMMKRLGAPFLLITDPRLEGGSFYMGSNELENKLKLVIQDCLNKLNFTENELILSGLSMGTFGALYYASDFSPHSVIVGKPLVNVGDIAENERIMRPGGFPTSLDILQSLTGTLSTIGVEALNNRFWKKFKLGNFTNTTFIVAYMKNDDYDVNAYDGLVQYLSLNKGTIIGKGIPGRHNDNSQSINQWFLNQYKRILRENFERKV